MATHLLANNAGATVSSGGTTAPAAGTSETWTLSSIVGLSATTGKTQMALLCGSVSGGVFTADSSEIVWLTNLSGTTATVTRGAESTTPFAHTAGFSVQAIASADALTKLRRGTIVLSAGNLSFTNLAATDTDAQLYALVDFTTATEVRFAYLLTNVTGATGSTLRPQWLNGSTWVDFAPACQLPLTGTAYTHEDSGWVAMSNVPNDIVQVRLVGSGGDGVADPKVQGVTLMWR